MSDVVDFDVVVIGAGFSGMYAVWKFRELGFSVKGIEAAADVGGVWWHNRYPGCRVDVEGYTYCYGPVFDDLRKNFEWTERFPSQPEVLRYLYAAADRLDIRKDFKFNARVKGASWNESGKLWKVELEEGGSAPITARFLVTAMGGLSAPQMPNIAGIHTFAGESYQAPRWPVSPDPQSTEPADIDFAGKRVGVIGTGSSGVQIIQEVAKTAEHLVVFQRSAAWCTPLGNYKINPDELASIRKNFHETDHICDTTGFGALHQPIDQSIFDVSPEEREATLERLYKGPGFTLWACGYRDVLTDPKANAIVTDFVTRKIRERVKDPKVADMLIPKDHGFGLRRPPLETGYYEVFNQSNVTLVDVKATPIERIVPEGVKTSDHTYELDMMIYASGFDALRGPIVRLDIRGRDGLVLNDVWRDGIVNYLGLQVSGFPNFFTLTGPLNSTPFGNVPRNTCQGTDWLAQLLCEMREKKILSVEPTPTAQTDYTHRVEELGKEILFSSVDSWFTGVNKNISGRGRRQLLVWPAGMPTYLSLCNDVTADNWRGLVFQH